MKSRTAIALALCASALIAAIAATSAAAVPSLDVQLKRVNVPLNRGDERLAYDVVVKNTASPNPKVGDTISCETGTIFGNPTPEKTYQWWRSGKKIEGETQSTHTLTAEDQGKPLQCQLTLTNDADGPASAFAPIPAISYSRSALLDPVPSPAPPTGDSIPMVRGPAARLVTATATTTAGSKVLTHVVTTKGTGTLTEDSKLVTGLTTSFGEFLGSVDLGGSTQQITAPGVTPEATGTGTAAEALPSGSRDNKVENVNTTSGEFVVGQMLTGEGLGGTGGESLPSTAARSKSRRASTTA